jgi:type II secretory pathway component PulF
VVGTTVKFTLVERFCRILAAMAGAGVPLPEALRVATDSLRNKVFVRALAHVTEAMLHGEGLARPLADRYRRDPCQGRGWWTPIPTLPPPASARWSS